MALELLLLVVLRVATLFLLRAGALRTVLLLEFRAVDLWATAFGALLVVLLLVTVVLRGVWVTVLLATVLRCGDLTVDDRWVTLRLPDDLVSFLRTDLVCTVFDLSTAVLPATLPLVRLERVPEFRATSPLWVLDA